MSEHALLPLIDYGNCRLSLKRLEEQYANYGSAEIGRPRFVQEAVAESVIWRFKVCYDCLWKVLRRYLIHRTGYADVPNGPKAIFRLADQNGLFRSSADQWLLYADARNGVRHEDHGDSAKACLEIVADFIDDVADLCETMSGEMQLGDPAQKRRLDAAMASVGSRTGLLPCDST